MIDKFYLVLGFWAALAVGLPFVYISFRDFFDEIKSVYGGTEKWR